MVEITKEDEKVLKELLLPKTIDEIAKNTGLDKETVIKTIEKLDKNRLIKKINDKYVLIDLVLDMLDKNYKFDITFVLEVVGNDEYAVNKASEFLEKRLEEDNRFEIISKEKMETVKEGDMYFSGFEVRLGFYTLEDVIYFIINYSPTTILDIYKPDKIELSREDLINVLSDIMIGIGQYINIISNLNKENFALKHYLQNLKNMQNR